MEAASKLHTTLIALGSNLPGLNGRTPAENIHESVRALKKKDFLILRLSPFYQTAPVPPSSQPNFINAVAVALTGLSPFKTMDTLHDIERSMGRTRSIKNEARILDLDLLDFNGLIVESQAGEETGGLVLPHPRLHERAFVLQPLCDVAPDWCHPTLGKSASVLLSELACNNGFRL